MRILHTSDWHVGRTIRGRSRATEHVAVLRELADIAAREQVDLVIVAGDVFDTSAPTAEAERIAYRALLDLVGTGAQVVIVAGNHDNPGRLAAVRPLLDLAGVHVGAFLAAPSDGGVLVLRARSGEDVRVALLPFLSQRSIIKADELMALDADQHAGRYAERCRQIVEVLTGGFERDTVNLVAAHLTVVGGALGGGERMAHTIFDYHVPPQVFPATAHYVALGHLHRAQRIPSQTPVWYSGSPLALDFGEADEAKSALIIDATPGVPARVTQVPLTQGRRLRTIEGTLDDIEAQRGRHDDAYLRVVVTEARRAGLSDQVREWFPDAVDVTIAVDTPTAATDDDLAGLQSSPHELFSEYLRTTGVDDPAVTALFDQLLEDEHAPDAA